jgi:hypothetical protein
MGQISRRSRLLDVAITMAILAVLYGTLSHYLSVMGESAERAAMQTTLMQIQRQMTLKSAKQYLHGTAVETELNPNPFMWFEPSLQGYQGEIEHLADLPKGDRRGVWYFDRSSKQLVYTVNRADHLIYLERDSEAARLQILRFVLNLSSKAADNQGIQLKRNARLEAVDQYRWDMDTND